MDALAELIPLLLVVGYYILAARRRAAKRRALEKRMQETPDLAPTGTAEVRAESPGPTPFEQFMAQLEDAMAEAAGEAEPEPEPPPAEPEPVAPAPKPPPRVEAPPRPSEFRAVAGSFDSAPPPGRKRQGTERIPTVVSQVSDPMPAYDPHDLHEQAAHAQSRHLDEMRRRLRSAEAAREAFVLQTIFGPRGGRRAENR
ncbi:MAG: hypothetical protein AAF845_19345 [Bacteroidota bacterium]